MSRAKRLVKKLTESQILEKKQKHLDELYECALDPDSGIPDFCRERWIHMKENNILPISDEEMEEADRETSDYLNSLTEEEYEKAMEEARKDWELEDD